MNDRKSFFVLLSCVAFYFLYTAYLQKKYPNYGKPAVEVAGQVEDSEARASEDVVAEKMSTSNSEPTKAPELVETSGVNRLAEQDLVIENQDVVYKFDQFRSALTSIKLKSYAHDVKDPNIKVDLVHSPLVIQGASSVTNKLGETGFHGVREVNTITFWKQEGAWKISQTFTIPEKGYGADVTFSWQNVSASAADLNASILMRENPNLNPKKSGGFLPGMPTEVSMALGVSGENEVERHDIVKYCKKVAEGDEKGPLVAVQNSPLHLIGIDQHYFIKALLPNGERMGYSMAFGGKVNEAACGFAISAWQPQGMVNAGDTVSLKFNAWFGPKDMDQMVAYAPVLKNTVDFGWFSIVAVPLLSAVKFAHSFTGNWGVAIILVTLLLKIIFFPLNKSAAVSAHKMKKLQPELKKLQEKHKDDRMALQQAMMKFYADQKVNPMKGCLPILPQMPVFIAFFRMLSGAIELRHAPFVGWLNDLSAADPYYITPLLLGVTYFIQQKLMPTPGMDKTQQNVMLMMPVIFSVMMITFPSGLVLYSLVNTIITIAQQVWINRKLGDPTPKLAMSDSK